MHFRSNTIAGACDTCHGLGITHTVSEQSLVPDPSLSIRDRAIAAWPGAWQGKNYRDILAVLGYDIDKPWKSCRKKSAIGFYLPKRSLSLLSMQNEKRIESNVRTRALT